jgi:hypothetical protein
VTAAGSPLRNVAARRGAASDAAAPSANALESRMHERFRRLPSRARATWPRIAGLAIVAGVAAAAHGAPGISVKPLQSWSGRLPLNVQPPLQSSLATHEDLARVWAQCRVHGAVPAIDFDRRIVLVAVRRGSSTRLTASRLVDGNLTTNVVVTPDMPAYQSCAIAVVDRTGIATVNGAPIGR